jgi:hypothetical protein
MFIDDGTIPADTTLLSFSSTYQCLTNNGRQKINQKFDTCVVVFFIDADQCEAHLA